MSETKTNKPKVSREEKKRRLIQEVQNLARKVKNLSSTHREASYWEQIESDCEKALQGPLV